MTYLSSVVLLRSWNRSLLETDKIMQYGIDKQQQQHMELERLWIFVGTGHSPRTPNENFVRLQAMNDRNGCMDLPIGEMDRS